MLLLYPSYLLYRALFRRLKTEKTAVYTGICTLIMPILFIWIFSKFTYSIIDPWLRSKKFDKTEWKADIDGRYRMMNDIIDNNLLAGKKKSEVIELLGKNFEEGPCDNCFGYPVYEPEAGFSPDHDVLAIYLDSSQHVIDTRRDSW